MSQGTTQSLRCLTEEIHEVSYNKGMRQYLYDKSCSSFNFRKQHSSSPHNRYTNNSYSHWTPTKRSAITVKMSTTLMHIRNSKRIEHNIDECQKFKKDKDKYTLIKANLPREYKRRLLRNAKKSNISYKHIISGMRLSDTSSDSE